MTLFAYDPSNFFPRHVLSIREQGGLSLEETSERFGVGVSSLNASEVARLTDLTGALARAAPLPDGTGLTPPKCTPYWTT